MHESVYNTFLELTAAYCKNRKISGPFETFDDVDVVESRKPFEPPSLDLKASHSNMGPIIGETRLQKVMSYIQAGIAEGANLFLGGRQVGTCGYFVEPTIFLDVPAHSSFSQKHVSSLNTCTWIINNIYLSS